MRLLNAIKSRLGKHNNCILKDIIYDLDKLSLREVIPKIDISWTWIDKDNYARVLDFREERIAESFRNMLKAKQKGIFAIHQNDYIAHCWAYIGMGILDKNIETNELIKIQKGEAYIYFCHTAHNYRGNNIYPYLLYLMSKHLFEVEGVSRVFIDTNVDNTASQSGIKKAGFHERFLVKRLRLLGITIINRRVRIR